MVLKTFQIFTTRGHSIIESQRESSQLKLYKTQSTFFAVGDIRYIIGTKAKSPIQMMLQC